MRFAAWLLRGFAFSLTVMLGGVVYYAPELREWLGPGSWAASLLPVDPARLAIWIGATSLNAGAALLLASYLES